VLLELRTRIVTWAIRDSIPVLNIVRRPAPWPSIEELRTYRDGTLGRETARLLDDRGLPLLAHYENHDALHRILDYDTTARGELELQAFMWGNRSSSPAGRVLFVWGAMMLPEHVGAMRKAFARGRRALPVREHLLPTRLHEPLSAILT
jgi:hypothetical protein